MTVSIQPKSANGKLAPIKLVRTWGKPRPVPAGPFVCSTSVSVWATCPDTCPYKGHGCYAESGKGYNGLQRLEVAAESEGVSALEVTKREAAELDKLFAGGVPQDGARGGRDMRLHVAGDVSGRVGAQLLSTSVARWLDRGGGTVWTYTHRWHSVERECWGRTQVLASIEAVDDIERAEAQGYACAITLVAFPSLKRFAIPGSDYSVIPCPAETRRKTCVECRLCFDTDRLRRRKLVIGFTIHGRDSKPAKRRLRVIQGDAFDAVPFQLVPQVPK